MYKTVNRKIIAVKRYLVCAYIIKKQIRFSDSQNKLSSEKMNLCCPVIAYIGIIVRITFLLCRRTFDLRFISFVNNGILKQ